MVAFHVGMCSHNGGKDKCDFTTTDVTTRFNVLRQCIADCFTAPLRDDELYCFVAPEFFFGSEALPKSDYHDLVRQCGALYSSRNMILVPGSMVTYSGSKLPHKKHKFANRLPVFYGGQLLNYEKHTSAGESAPGGVGTFRQGKHDGTFSVQMNSKQYTFAVEVCAEHDNGFAINKYSEDVDVHIITSNSVTYRAKNDIGKQYTIHCDANQMARRSWLSFAVYKDGAKIDPNFSARFEIARWDLNLT